MAAGLRTKARANRHKVCANTGPIRIYNDNNSESGMRNIVSLRRAAEVRVPLERDFCHKLHNLSFFPNGKRNKILRLCCLFSSLFPPKRL